MVYEKVFQETLKERTTVKVSFCFGVEQIPEKMSVVVETEEMTATLAVFHGETDEIRLDHFICRLLIKVPSDWIISLQMEFTGVTKCSYMHRGCQRKYV